MSANDVIVLKAHFTTWKTQRAEGLAVDPWLYYCIEQFMKRYGLSDEELEYGITDGSMDGGADAIYFRRCSGMMLLLTSRLRRALCSR